jgi:hypothetical protein
VLLEHEFGEDLHSDCYRQIGVRSRSQAVAWAIQHGFATHDSADAIVVRDG